MLYNEYEVFFMQLSNFYQILNQDINMTDIVCIFQQWTSANNSYSYQEIPRPNSGIIIVTNGKLVYSEQNGNSVSAVPGDIIYIPKGAYYTVKFTQVPQNTMLINFFLYNNQGKEISFFENITKIMSGANGFIFDLFEEICNIYLKTSNKIIVKAKVFELIDIIAAQQANQKNTSAITPAVDYINNHIDETIKISHLAKLCLMSESTFRREFIRLNGVSPKKCILDKKIKKAKQLLSNSELSINEIYLALGFYDNAHFFKRFKEYTDITPLQYRTKYQHLR